MRITVFSLFLFVATACDPKPKEPEGPPIGKHVPRDGEPLPGAFEACSGKAAGLTCSIGYRTGTCQYPVTGEPRLACTTEGGPGGPPSH